MREKVMRRCRGHFILSRISRIRRRALRIEEQNYSKQEHVTERS